MKNKKCECCKCSNCDKHYPNEYAAAPAMYYKMRALFGNDPRVTIFYYDESAVADFIVSDKMMAEALENVVQSIYDFGDGETMLVTINGKEFSHGESNEDDMNIVFRENPNFSRIVTMDTPMMPNRTFIMFKNKTIAYQADNFGNPNGYYVATPEQLAQEIIDAEGAFVTTEVK